MFLGCIVSSNPACGLHQSAEQFLSSYPVCKKMWWWWWWAGGIECSPKVNSFHSWLDVVRYCGQVSEGTVYFSWDVTSTRRGATTACLQQSCREQQGFQQPRLQVRGSAGTHTHCARGWSPAAKAREATLCPQTLMKTTYRKRAREHACQSIKTFNLIYSTLYL